jgi:hypothetical protein
MLHRIPPNNYNNLPSPLRIEMGHDSGSINMIACSGTGNGLVKLWCLPTEGCWRPYHSESACHCRMLCETIRQKNQVSCIDRCLTYLNLLHIPFPKFKPGSEKDGQSGNSFLHTLPSNKHPQLTTPPPFIKKNMCTVREELTAAEGKKFKKRSTTYKNCQKQMEFLLYHWSISQPNFARTISR